MQKDITVLLVCVLMLFADLLSFWKAIELWLSDQVSFDHFTSFVILTALSLFAVLLVWLNCVLIRKIAVR